MLFKPFYSRFGALMQWRLARGNNAGQPQSMRPVQPFQCKGVANNQRFGLTHSSHRMLSVCMRYASSIEFAQPLHSYLAIAEGLAADKCDLLRICFWVITLQSSAAEAVGNLLVAKRLVTGVSRSSCGASHCTFMLIIVHCTRKTSVPFAFTWVTSIEADLSQEVWQVASCNSSSTQP